MTKRSATAATLAALALALSGCSGAENTTSETPAAKESNVSASQAAESAVASAEASAADEGGLTFGDTHTWKDGLAVTISKPQDFTPGQYAAGTESEGTPQMFEVAVKNGTDKPVEAMGLSIQASSGGAQDDAIFDTESGIEVPTVAIQPGKSLSWKVAFNVTDPEDLTLDVSSMHNFTAEKVYFTAK